MSYIALAAPVARWHKPPVHPWAAVLQHSQFGSANARVNSQKAEQSADIVVATSVLINEVDADSSGADTAEFVELYGPPNTPLDGLCVVFFNGSNDGSYL